MKQNPTSKKHFHDTLNLLKRFQIQIELLANEEFEHFSRQEICEDLILDVKKFSSLIQEITEKESSNNDQ
jgi:hypothetical protein